jgi:outer membrane protein OmpA-like peptidoglycan-associated protein
VDADASKGITMKTPSSIPAKLLTSALFVILLATAPISTAIAQQDLTADEIAEKLKPKKLTRSLTAQPADDSKQELDEILSRSIGIVERKKIVELTEKAQLPRLDFAITFEYDSAEIRSGSYHILDTLAEALKTDALQATNFLVNGHTDAKGSDDYNQELSQRRADAVAAYLVDRHDISADRLQAIGFGESKLKDDGDPESADNRRVEIITRP